MLTLGEGGPIQLPNYKYTKKLQKNYLLEYCLSSPELSLYLPSNGYLLGIKREFLISVKSQLTVIS